MFVLCSWMCNNWQASCVVYPFSILRVCLFVDRVSTVYVCACAGYLRYSRDFSDGVDLNRVFPGKADGDCSQVFAYKVCLCFRVCLSLVCDLCLRCLYSLCEQTDYEPDCAQARFCG